MNEDYFKRARKKMEINQNIQNRHCYPNVSQLVGFPSGGAREIAAKARTV